MVVFFVQLHFTTRVRYGFLSVQLNYTIRLIIKIKSEPLLRFALNGDPGGIRTPGLLIRSQTLYPAELLSHIKLRLVKAVDLKPTAFKTARQMITQ